jgi:hypothetical protein
MWRRVAMGIVLAGLLAAVCAGCSLGHDAATTHLVITLRKPDTPPRRVALTCSPTGTTSVHNADAVCAALEDYLPREMHPHSVCSCGVELGWRVVVTGTIKGTGIHEPVEVSYCGSCGLAPQARNDVTTVLAAFGLAHA